MTKTNISRLLTRIFSILLWIVVIVLWIPLIREKTIPRLWAVVSVRPSTVLPTPIAVGQPFEYCVLKEDAGLMDEVQAGTPIPVESVSLGPKPTETAAFLAPILPIEAGAIVTPEPVEPTSTQPVYDEIGGWQVEVINMGEAKENNFHLVVIGVGFIDEAQNEAKLREIASGLEVNFTGVRIDFAYVRSPLNLNLKHVGQMVDFSNTGDLDRVLAKIREVHPVDSVAIAIETPFFLGTADAKQFAMFTASDSNTLLMATHETAHLLGLGDGYQAFYIGMYLPNSELFYLDSMPRILSDALPKLESIPPLYEVGTCKGRKLYTFYERSNNIMNDYDPKGPNSWGDSVFTPLQIQVMNNFVATLK